VDLLFLLSGFLLAYVYIQRHEQFDSKSYRQFLWQRLIRFYPAYLVALSVLMFAVGLAWLLEFPLPDHYRLQVLPFRLLLLQAWPFLSWTMWSWNFPTWFLSALWFGYLFAVPCIWKLFPKIRASRFALLWVFAPMLVNMLLHRLTVLKEFHAVLQACCEMIAGGALCALYLERKPFVAAMQRHLDKIVLLFLISSISVLLISAPLTPLIINRLLRMACPLLLAGLTAERSRTARLLATRPFLWIGKISYSLFVGHAVVLIPLRGLLPPDRFAGSPLSLRCAILAFYASAILGFAVALYKFVEIPCARVLKRLSATQPVKSLEKSALIPQQAN
jgi:peptidoglycan/LPS O-acetylase OafA/YrhL